VRQYEEDLARALAIEAGNDPAKDLYAQLVAATLLATMVSAARWHNANFAADDEPADTEIFAKLILSRFPPHAEIETEKRRIIRTAGARRSRKAARERAGAEADNPVGGSP